MVKTPVLFIIFNRPETTRRVFDVIRKYKPTELYIAADGPREGKLGEKEKCEEARKITEKINWPCKVKRLYRDRNLGCKYGPYTAINWFFENVEEGIILEDDCFPDISFFDFCHNLLRKYRNNSKIMHITGDNFQNGIHRGESGASYYFSKYPNTWGWATWRRAWKNYSIKIDTSNKKYSNWFSGMKLLEKIYWASQFYCVNSNLLDAWDYQWLFTVLSNKSLCVVPNVNLVKNIGDGQDATHTGGSNNLIKDMEIGRILRIKHSDNIVIDAMADAHTLNNVFDIKPSKICKIFSIIPYRIYKNIF